MGRIAAPTARDLYFLQNVPPLFQNDDPGTGSGFGTSDGGKKTGCPAADDKGMDRIGIFHAQ
jgi:hypothetical protein